MTVTTRDLERGEKNEEEEEVKEEVEEYGGKVST